MLRSSQFFLNWRCCTAVLDERSSGGIWKFRISFFKYVDHSHTLYSSGNIDVRNWIHLFESRCILSVLRLSPSVLWVRSLFSCLLIFLPLALFQCLFHTAVWISEYLQLPNDGLEIILKKKNGRAYWREYPIIDRRDRKILRKSVNIHGAVTEMRTEHLPDACLVFVFHKRTRTFSSFSGYIYSGIYSNYYSCIFVNYLQL